MSDVSTIDMYMLMVVHFYNMERLSAHGSYRFTWDACEEGDGYCAGFASTPDTPSCDPGGFPY